MDQNAKERSQLYKITGKPWENLDWARCLSLDKQMKRIVRIKQGKQTQRLQKWSVLMEQRKTDKMWQRENLQRIYKRRGTHGKWVELREVYPQYADHRMR